MDFQDTPEEAEFRAEANAFLSKHLKPKNSAAFANKRKGDGLQRAKDWQKLKAEGGFAQITWPKEIGGRGGTSFVLVALPSRSCFPQEPMGKRGCGRQSGECSSLHSATLGDQPWRDSK